MPESIGTWLYAITGPVADVPTGLRGVAGEPVHALPCGDLTAVVGTVGLPEFGAEAWEQALTDSSRLGHLARTHHEVVSAIAATTTAIPFRLATVYLGDDRVRQFVDTHRDELHRTLRSIDGRDEWGVKGYAVAPPKEPAATASGTAYLERRRRQLARNPTGSADQVHATLAALAAAAVRDGPDVLKAAYLVDRTSAEAFAATVRSLSGTDGLRLELTGPWAAYSFTTLREQP
ncbi:GvpL/GvpF family gas vesicle protein [Actinoplanes sp. NPDC051859]|uniref:GvpL/GvpF family gas vesicle protein n=1 Tax=Actinoplanes sp. NPDC051859 TaxID=3363909 RepID=UPI0037B8D89E